MATRAKNRPSRTNKRIPVRGARDILTVDGKDKNFKYSWINDTGNMLSRFEQGGYEFVDHDVEVGQLTVDSSTNKNVSRDVGKGVTAYLMRIKKEWYEDDMREKHARITEKEESMRRNLNSGSEGTYGKVNIG